MTKRSLRTLIVSAGVMVALAGPASAQKPVTWQINAGYPIAVGTTSDFMTGQFSWGAGLRYSPPDAAWGLRLDVRNSRFDGKTEALQAILDAFDATGASARTWDFTLQGEIGMPKDAKVRLYAIGGVGYYNRYGKLTEPALVTGCYWDPWWGYICGSGVAEETVVSKSDWAFGVNAGAGISFNAGRGASIFVEGVYNLMFTANSDPDNPSASGSNTTWMPIYIGVRF